jgi:hypothetical protein
MLTIPLQPTPSQTLSITLDGQLAKITLRTLGSLLYFSLDGVVATRVCRDRQRLLVDAGYRGFRGDFAFVDQRGASDPVFTGLGDRYQLVYFNDGE